MSRGSNLAERGEEAAVRFLERRGYEVVERGWSCGEGAVEIIARAGDELVFVEVKTRRGNTFPLECCSEAKAARFMRLAALYAVERGLVDAKARLDTVTVLLIGERAIMRHYVGVLQAHAESGKER